MKYNFNVHKKIVALNVNSKNLSYGKKIIEFLNTSSPASKTILEKDGYCVHKILNKNEFIRLKRKCLIIVNKLSNKKASRFNIYKNNCNKQHESIVTKTVSLTENDFDINILEQICKEISKKLKKNLTMHNKLLNRSHIQLRLNRPNSYDFNPPHKDSYFEEYKNTINVWIPIFNCNNKTSLPLIPKSHLISENKLLVNRDNKKIKINNNFYNVPCICKIDDHEMNFIRPKIGLGNCLIFSSHLIHGLAINKSNNIRVSLELRLSEIN